MCVQQSGVIDRLRAEKEEKKQLVKKLKSEILTLKRRLSQLEPGGSVAKRARPGPDLKPFEELTPRSRKQYLEILQAQVFKTSEERKILPSRLSAYLTQR